MDGCTIRVGGMDVALSDDEARDARKAIAAHFTAQRLAWEAEQKARGQVWKVRYWRHFSDYDEEAYSLDEAVGMLVPAEYGDLAPESITCPDGTVLDSSAIYDLTERAVSESRR